MTTETNAKGNAPMLLISWVVVGVPLVWGVYNTIPKLPALFH
jgi:hypothetical protein